MFIWSMGSPDCKFIKIALEEVHWLDFAIYSGLELHQFEKKTDVNRKCIIHYRMRAIITRGLYIFYPIFKVYFFVFKEVFSENSVRMYG